jgi:hypothetical protein
MSRLFSRSSCPCGSSSALYNGHLPTAEAAECGITGVNDTCAKVRYLRSLDSLMFAVPLIGGYYYACMYSEGIGKENIEGQP